MTSKRALRVIPMAVAACSIALASHAIMAGGEFELPEDMPSSRLDEAGTDSIFNFVGGLEVSTGTGDFLGTGTALSRRWALTAGHNVDFDDDGVLDSSNHGGFPSGRLHWSRR